MAKWIVIVKIVVLSIWLCVRMLAYVVRIILNLLDTACEYLHCCVKSFNGTDVLLYSKPLAPESCSEIKSLKKGEIQRSARIQAEVEGIENELRKGEMERSVRMKAKAPATTPVPSTFIGEGSTMSARSGVGMPVGYFNGPTTEQKAGQKKKYYAVVRGYQPGIYETWDECDEQVWGFSDHKHKSFKTRAEAVEYMRNGG